MNINYEYYRMFYYVAKYKSFTKAAEALSNNQPNVTRTIKNLESALDCSLFIRNTRGVTLTPEGESLFSRISIAFEQIQAAEEEISLSKSLESGIVYIGATEIALHGFLFDVLNNFHKKYPKVKIRITNHSTPNAIKALNNQLVDFAVVTAPLQSDDQIMLTRIKSFQDFAVVGSEYSELRNKKVSLKELTEYQIISLPKETATYDFYSNLFSRHNLPFSVDAEGATTDQLLPMVKYNLGIGFLPDFFIEDSVRNEQIFKLDLSEHIPARDICLAEHKNKFISLAARELKKMIINKREVSL